MPPRTTPLPADVIAALQRGGVLEALKLVLAAKAGGVKAEKRPDGHAGSPPKSPRPAIPSSKASHLSPGEVPRSNTDFWLLLVLGAALYGAYHFFSR